MLDKGRQFFRSDATFGICMYISVSPFYQLDVSDDGTNYSTKFERAKVSKQTFSINKRYLAAMKY